MTALNHTTTDIETANTERYYAQHYADATGFYFTDWADYCQKINAHSCEEFEIQYIDGELAELFQACGVSQSNLDLWLDVVVGQMPDHERVSLFYLCDVLGYSLEEGIEAVDDYPVTQGTALQYAEEYIENTGMLDPLPQQLRYYFDVYAFARDKVLNGDIYAFTYNGTDYTACR